MTSLRAQDAALDGLIEAASKIAQRDVTLRKTLKAAILRDDVAQVLEVACSLARVEPSGSVLALIHSRANAVA